MLRRSNGNSSSKSSENEDFPPVPGHNGNGNGTEFWALKDVTFDVNQGEVMGIIGRNGAGKTTLLKILSQITEPTNGEIHVRGRVASLLEVGTGFHGELTGRENIFLNGAILGMTRSEIKRKYDEIVAFSGVEKFIDTPVKRYSTGMYVRLAFAVAAHLEPEILVVDEVLAVGDIEFQKKCLGKMDDISRSGRTVFFVSHNLSAIRHLCTKAILLTSGELAHIDDVARTIDAYEKSISSEKPSDMEMPAHVIFQSGAKEPQSDFEIVKIEILDANGQPMEAVSTWDNVVFRIVYHASRAMHSLSVAMEIRSRHEVPILLLSTQPDSTVTLDTKPGLNTVDCEIQSLPLSSGEFTVGAGIAIPRREWLYKDDHLGKLKVLPKDVYESGFSPEASRSLLAVNHQWKDR
jgi:lipopolysaccharide transport system ATP-binding protein